MIPAAVGLNPYQKSLLAPAGAQQEALCTILSQALAKPQPFKDPEIVKKLSATIQQIPLTRLNPFLSAFRKLIRDCNLYNDFITFTVMNENCHISRAIVIAFSHIWATNLSYLTQDQTQPIVVIKPDEASPPFQPGIMRCLLNFLITQKLPNPFPENAKKSMIKAADVYGIPSLRLAIHETVGISSDQDLLNWLRFSHSTVFLDKVPNRHLRTCLQLSAEIMRISQSFLNNFTEDERKSTTYGSAFFWIHFKKNERNFAEAYDGLNPFQYSVSWHKKTIELWGPDLHANVYRDGTERRRICLVAMFINRCTLPKLRMYRLREEELSALLDEVPKTKTSQDQGWLLSQLKLYQMNLTSTVLRRIQTFLVPHPSIDKITVDDCFGTLQPFSFQQVGVLKIKSPAIGIFSRDFVAKFCSNPSLRLGKFSLKGKFEVGSLPSIFQSLRSAASLHTLKIAMELRDDRDDKYGLSKEVSEEIMKSLSQYTQLTELSFACGQITQEALTAFPQRLSSLRSLKVVDLWYNKLNTQSLSKIADILPALPSMVTLKLDLNNIHSILPLAQRLSEPCSVTFLDLRKNRLGDEGALQLSEAIGRNTTVQYLDLSFNGIAIEGMRTLATMIRANQILKTFLLGVKLGRHEGHYDENAQDMKHYPNLFNDQVATDFAESLKQNHSLISLELPGSCSLPGAQALAAIFIVQTTLKSLQVDLKPDAEAQNPFGTNPRFIRTPQIDRFRNQGP